MNRVIVGLILVVLATLAHPASGHELQVVTTFSILEDFVVQVGGDRVLVNSLVPAGADPHSWEPTPREARIVAQADLLVANGGGFDDWLVALMTNAARADSPLIYASQGLEALSSEHDHGHEEEGGHHHGDPHFWLSVPNAIFYVEMITQSLVALSPENATYFQVRSKAYVEELMKLDAWMVEELAVIPQQNRIIVTYHNAFSYLAERYGFEVAEFLVANPEAEPSPRDLAKLVDLLRGMNRRSVFTEPQLASGSRYMQALAREVQGTVYTLFSDSLIQEVSTYVEMMEYNTRTLVEALK